VLLRMDPSHHSAELANARANLAAAEHAYARTEATVRSSGVDLDASRKTKLARGTYQLDEARARLDVARQAVRLAEAQLAKTIVRAPFEGRVAKKMIDTNEVATIGRPIAQIYSTDAAEVRLPLSMEQFQLIDVPEQYNNQRSSTREPLVVFTEANSDFHWIGRIKRSEGFINPSNRLIYVIAKVTQPYAQDPAQPQRPPLIAGTFVEATIQGRAHENVATLPLEAVHEADQVWILDKDNRLQFRHVKVLYRGLDRAYITNGLDNGMRVVLTPLEVSAENMELAVSANVQEPKPILGEDILQMGKSAATPGNEENTSQIAPNAIAPTQPASEPVQSAPPAGTEGMTGINRQESEVEP
jgi:RND family efflux transporter MFP subunit